MHYVKNVIALLGFAVLLGVAQSRVEAQTRWYNGDLDGSGALRNQSGVASTFENFTVTDAGGWHVNELWSNNVTDTGAFGATADWSIRTGMSVGNGGTVIASGITSASVTPTGRTLFGSYTEYKVDVFGLSIDLAPGGYWLSVSPTMTTGLAFNSFTSGANGTGTPVADNTSLFNYHPGAGSNYEQTDFAINSPRHGDNFSMGVGGTNGGTSVTPEGSSLVMLSLGLLPLGLGLRKKLRKA